MLPTFRLILFRPFVLRPYVLELLSTSVETHIIPIVCIENLKRVKFWALKRVLTKDRRARNNERKGKAYASHLSSRYEMPLGISKSHQGV